MGKIKLSIVYVLPSYTFCSLNMAIENEKIMKKNMMKWKKICWIGKKFSEMDKKFAEMEKKLVELNEKMEKNEEQDEIKQKWKKNKLMKQNNCGNKFQLLILIIKTIKKTYIN